MPRSKQTNFFITPEDWLEISRFFLTHGVKFVRVPFKNNSIILTNDVSSMSADESYITYLIADQFKDKIFTKFHKTGFGIDGDKSYCIEFNRGGLYPDESTLQRARFYTVLEYYDGGNLIKKSDVFQYWVNNMYRKFKAKFLHKSDHDKDFPMSRKAIEWIELNQARVDASGLIVRGNSGFNHGNNA
jgi:hypothetical protein